jgi:FlaA1/EpsC-like NDP-sugar epimerase
VYENLITLTDPKMTRFFASKREVVHKALKAFSTGAGGEMFIPKMKAATLELLSSIMIEHLGNTDTRIERIAVRPGEKYGELLISRHETPRTWALSDVWVILPLFPSPILDRRYQRTQKVSFSEYGSDDAPQFSRWELAALLREEGFLSRNVPPSTSPLYFTKGSSVFH